jgi:hypothetical protein
MVLVTWIGGFDRGRRQSKACSSLQCRAWETQVVS